jgi:hypothetical protein
LDASSGESALALLVARVGADNPDDALAADYLAVLAYAPDRSLDFHSRISNCAKGA